ncbi:6634_t:CDS:2, partial [Cetraspora pellucida]
FSKSSQSSETLTIADILGNNLRLNSLIIASLLFEDRIQKKHIRESTNKPSNKKIKKPVKKESDILEDLIKELSTEPETQYYRSKIEKKDFKEVLDRVKKDLQEIANSNSDFDTTRKKKAQEIIDNWKEWTISIKNLKKDLRINIQVEQQILASGNANQNIGTINSHCTALGKCQNDNSEGTPKGKRQDTGDRETINEPVETTDDPESDTQTINTKQNLNEKQVEEELVRRYSFRERKETNYTDVSGSDIDPYHYQAFSSLSNNPDSSIISLNRPIISETTYNLISTHIICAFNSTLHMVKESVEENLFEKIERLLNMRNKLILSKQIMQKLETIFEADFSEITLKIITEMESEKNMEKTEESQFLFFIRHALLDFVTMFKNLLPKVLNRDMSERTYIVESISPIFRSFRNAFPEIKYEWIEKDVRSVKKAGSMFAINIKSWKTDLLVIRLSDATEILHVEVSGPPFKVDKKHTIGDIKKLLMMVAIGDKLTLFSVSLVDKKKYLAIELASCVIPFSFEEIGCYIKIFNFFAIIRNEFNEQKKLLKKIHTFVPLVEDDT